MKRIVISLSLLISFLVSVLIAGPEPRSSEENGQRGPVQVADRPPKALYQQDVGNFWNTVTNFGIYGDPWIYTIYDIFGSDTVDVNQYRLFPSGEWPGGSGVHYLYVGSLWIGTTIDDIAYVSGARYTPLWEFQPSEGARINDIKSMKDVWVRYDDEESFSRHEPVGWHVSERIMAWDYEEYDDFQISYVEIENQSPRELDNVYVSLYFNFDCACYESDVEMGNVAELNRQYLDDLVDYDGWAPANENPWQYDWVDPLDLDGNGVTGYDYWGWPIADPKNPYWDGYVDEFMPDSPVAEQDGIYDEFQIYQCEHGPIIRCQIDVPDKNYRAGEPVITSDGDTLRGYLLSRNISYMMDGNGKYISEQDYGERHKNPPGAAVIGSRLLYAPIEPFYETQADTIPRPYSHQWWNWETAPNILNDEEEYQYMIGCGGASHGMRFMPHPFDYEGGAPVFEYEYLQTYGPFNHWEPDETKKFVMAMGAGWGLQGLRENLDNAMVFYYTGNHDIIGDPILTLHHPEDYGDQLGFTGSSDQAVASDMHFMKPVPPLEPELMYSPGDGKVHLFWDSAAESYYDVLVDTADFLGYKVYRSAQTLSDWELIAAFDIIDESVYLVTTEGDTVNPIIVDADTLTRDDSEYESVKTVGVQGSDWTYLHVNLPGTGNSDIAHEYTDSGGDFFGENGEPIFRGIEAPINGMDYYYTVVSFDRDNEVYSSLESSRTNYRKDAFTNTPSPVRPSAAAAVQGDLSKVKVVPNPYKGTAQFEQKYESRITFINLPPQCRLTIFSLTGDLIKEYTKSDALSGTITWDLVSHKNQQIKSGLYLYTVETPEGNKSIGKFLVIR